MPWSRAFNSHFRNSRQGACSMWNLFPALFGLIFVLVLIRPVPALAQVSATLSGVVSDSSGSVVAGADIAVRNVETGELHNTQTDAAGRYQVFALLIGEYEVTATKNGFAAQVRTGIHLVVGQVARADLQLRVGELSQQIKVESDASMVNVTTADISGLVGERQVKDLPLNGRSYDLLLTLNPGIVNFTTQKTGGTGISNS